VSVTRHTPGVGRVEAGVDELLALAIEAARAGGAVLQQGRDRNLEILEKEGSRTSIVTWADLRAQEEITRVILGRHPHHALIGEEGKAGDPAATHAWYVDPVDGTTNYSHGFPHYCLSIALRDPQGIALGVIHDPHHGDLFVGVRAGRATHNGQPMRVSGVADLRQSLLATQVQSDDPGEVDRYAQRVRRFAEAGRAVRSVGSPALALAYVARGWLDAFCEPRMSPWDTHAGALMIQRAGGRVTTFAGRSRPVDRPSSILASNGLLHESLLELLEPEVAAASEYDASAVDGAP
jgi:myo-inositol-1(or 4)-monophosphatase